MKIYKVKVNDKVYEVQIESVTEQAGSIEVSNAAPQAQATSGKEETIVAPMAGNILDVKVKVGDAVQKGQVVAILEAMKLENEVVATASGTVKQVLVNKGTAVTNQQAIIIVG